MSYEKLTLFIKINCFQNLFVNEKMSSKSAPSQGSLHFLDKISLKEFVSQEMQMGQITYINLPWVKNILTKLDAYKLPEAMIEIQIAIADLISNGDRDRDLNFGDRGHAQELFSTKTLKFQSIKAPTCKQSHMKTGLKIFQS